MSNEKKIKKVCSRGKSSRECIPTDMPITGHCRWRRPLRPGPRDSPCQTRHRSAYSRWRCRPRQEPQSSALRPLGCPRIEARRRPRRNPKTRLCSRLGLLEKPRWLTHCWYQNGCAPSGGNGSVAAGQIGEVAVQSLFGAAWCRSQVES